MTAKQLQQAIEIIEGKAGKERAESDGALVGAVLERARHELPACYAIGTAGAALQFQSSAWRASSTMPAPVTFSSRSTSSSVSGPAMPSSTR